MKGGVNIWVALRDTLDSHRAWMHVAAPYVESDMPRSISDPRKAKDSAHMAAAKAAAAAATAAARGGAKPAVTFDLTATATSMRGKPATPSTATRARRPKSAIALAIETESMAEFNELGVAVL
jgi:hypothetical protein